MSRRAPFPRTHVPSTGFLKTIYNISAISQSCQSTLRSTTRYTPRTSLSPLSPPLRSFSRQSFHTDASTPPSDDETAEAIRRLPLPQDTLSVLTEDYPIRNGVEVSIPCPVPIPPQSLRVIEILRDVCEKHSPSTEVRIAGGWVRDLLRTHSDYHVDHSAAIAQAFGQPSSKPARTASTTDPAASAPLSPGLRVCPVALEAAGGLGDLDIALSDLTGAQFSSLIAKECAERDIPCSIVDIAPQTLLSRHLATSRGYVAGVAVDLVNLRAEAYTDTQSRVPAMRFGSVAEDASRRDFTVNALYYNVRTGLIEDWNGGAGLEDLRRGVLRTPMPAADIFLDDPLRVLRVLRFAARFSFIPALSLLRAARLPAVQAGLRGKVSRERVGQEVHKAFTGAGVNVAWCARLCWALACVDHALPLDGLAEGRRALVRQQAGLATRRPKVPPADDGAAEDLEGEEVSLTSLSQRAIARVLQQPAPQRRGLRWRPPAEGEEDGPAHTVPEAPALWAAGAEAAEQMVALLSRAWRAGNGDAAVPARARVAAVWAALLWPLMQDAAMHRTLNDAAFAPPPGGSDRDAAVLAALASAYSPGVATALPATLAQAQASERAADAMLHVPSGPRAALPVLAMPSSLAPLHYSLGQPVDVSPLLPLAIDTDADADPRPAPLLLLHAPAAAPALAASLRTSAPPSWSSAAAAIPPFASASKPAYTTALAAAHGMWWRCPPDTVAPPLADQFQPAPTLPPTAVSSLDDPRGPAQAQQTPPQLFPSFSPLPRSPLSEVLPAVAPPTHAADLDAADPAALAHKLAFTLVDADGAVHSLTADSPPLRLACGRTLSVPRLLAALSRVHATPSSLHAHFVSLAQLGAVAKALLQKLTVVRRAAKADHDGSQLAADQAVLAAVRSGTVAALGVPAALVTVLESYVATLAAEPRCVPEGAPALDGLAALLHESRAHAEAVLVRTRGYLAAAKKGSADMDPRYYRFDGYSQEALAVIAAYQRVAPPPATAPTAFPLAEDDALVRAPFPEAPVALPRLLQGPAFHPLTALLSPPAPALAPALLRVLLRRCPTPVPMPPLATRMGPADVDSVLHASLRLPAAVTQDVLAAAQLARWLADLAEDHARCLGGRLPGAAAAHTSLVAAAAEDRRRLLDEMAAFLASPAAPRPCPVISGPLRAIIAFLNTPAPLRAAAAALAAVQLRHGLLEGRCPHTRALLAAAPVASLRPASPALTETLLSPRPPSALDPVTAPAAPSAGDILQLLLLPMLDSLPPPHPPAAALPALPALLDAALLPHLAPSDAAAFDPMVRMAAGATKQWLEMLAQIITAEPGPAPAAPAPGMSDAAAAWAAWVRRHGADEAPVRGPVATLDEVHAQLPRLLQAVIDAAVEEVRRSSL